MNENKEIVRSYKKKILEIKKHNQHYYQYDAPKISDREYDLLKKEALELEKNFPI